MARAQLGRKQQPGIPLRKAVGFRRQGGMLTAWDRVAHRGGLPQRALSSAVLSNLYLMPLDDVLLQFAIEDENGPSVVRWVDDIWIFGSDVGSLRRAQVQIQRRLAS